MDLELYRRHGTGCKHRSLGNGFTKCRCPVWCYGVIDGRPIRQSLKTRDWARAIKRAETVERQAELDPAQTLAQKPRSLADAIAAYLDDAAIRGVRPSTREIARHALGKLSAFFPGRLVNSLDADAIRSYRGSRDIGPSTHAKELIVFRAFFHWCVKQGYFTENPAKAVAMPKIAKIPTLPLTQDEVSKVLDACGRLDNPNKAFVPYARIRARAAILVMIYSGLRISDVAMLRRDAIDKDGRLFLHTEKTEVPIKILLPRFVIDALAALPARGEYFFRSGADANLPRTAAAVIRRALAAVGRIAGIHLHPHRLRDTFACWMLESGADIRTVSKALGHKSIATTEKHYAPWVKSHQDLLDRATAALPGLEAL